MAFQDHIGVFSFKAGAAITANRVVIIDSVGSVIHPSNNEVMPIGVALESAAIGAAVPVVCVGIVKVEANAAIAAGVPVAAVIAATDGRIDDAVPSNTPTSFHYLLGVALEPAAAQGNLIAVLLTPGHYSNATDAGL